MSKGLLRREGRDRKNILGKPYVDDFTSIYSLGKEIGGFRYVCTEKGTEITYACHRLPKWHYNDDTKMERVRRNVEIRQHMSNYKKQHPNILEFKAAYEDDDYVYLMTELWSKDPLIWFYSKDGKEIDEEEAAYPFWQVLNAVHAFHSTGVMVRNLALIWDFWILPEDKGKLLIKADIYEYAVFINDGNFYDNFEYNERSYGGYKSPEIRNRPQNYGKEADICAAGAILYRLLTLHSLDREAGELIYLDDWINKELSGKSAAAKDLLKKMLKSEPKQRITAAEALEHPWVRYVDVTFPDFVQFKKLRRFPCMAEVLASEEENQRLKQLLNRMDTFASTITSEELKIGLSSLTSRLSEPNIKEINAAIEEFCRTEFFINLMDRHKNENIHKAFLFFDKDGDGQFITRDDLGQAMTPYRIGGEAAINEIIGNVDADKDGKIDYGESKAMIKKEMQDYDEKQRRIKF